MHPRWLKWLRNTFCKLFLDFNLAKISAVQYSTLLCVSGWVAIYVSMYSKYGMGSNNASQDRSTVLSQHALFCDVCPNIHCIVLYALYCPVCTVLSCTRMHACALCLGWCVVLHKVQIYMVNLFGGLIGYIIYCACALGLGWSAAHLNGQFVQ